MTTTVNVGVHALPDTLFVIDEERRTYLGLSRDASYWHSIRPARPDDLAVTDALMAVGDLLCSCVAGRLGRRCYWTKDADRHEASQADQAAAPKWLGKVAPETELEKAAARG